MSMGKEDVAYKHNGILLSHKKSEIMPLAATWMDLEVTIRSEVSQTEKDKYIWYCLYVESKKKKKYTKWTYLQTEIDP